MRPFSARTAGFGILKLPVSIQSRARENVNAGGFCASGNLAQSPNFGQTEYVQNLARISTITVDTETVTAYIGLGSNLGDRAGNLLMAVRGLMEASFEVTKLSAIYETEAVEMEDAPGFLNMVAEIRAESITPTQMLARMLRIEYLLGRKEKSLKLPRTIDLDLLLYGDLKMETPFLTLPHPRLHLRRFVLVPLAEIAPMRIHPVLHKNALSMLDEVNDSSSVSRWYPNGLEHTGSFSGLG